jgi:hypothetical protein
MMLCRQCVVGVDWDDVKVKAANREFPFHVPAVILSKSCAELNYVST